MVECGYGYLRNVTYRDIDVDINMIRYGYRH